MTWPKKWLKVVTSTFFTSTMHPKRSPWWPFRFFGPSPGITVYHDQYATYYRLSIYCGYIWFNSARLVFILITSGETIDENFIKTTPFVFHLKHIGHCIKQIFAVSRLDYVNSSAMSKNYSIGKDFRFSALLIFHFRYKWMYGKELLVLPTSYVCGQNARQPHRSFVYVHVCDWVWKGCPATMCQ